MFEPVPGAYVWNLQTKLAFACGGNHGEIDVANRVVREAARAGADAGTTALFDSWITVAEQVARNGEADEAAGHRLSAGSKYLRASGYVLAAERTQSRDHAPRWAAYDRGLAPYRRGMALRGPISTLSRSLTPTAVIPRSSSAMGRVSRGRHSFP